jgi:hypothetical protein
MFEDIVLPINFAIHKSDSPGISLKTRSIWDLVQILGSTIQLPEDSVDTASPIGLIPTDMIFTVKRLRRIKRIACFL